MRKSSKSIKAEREVFEKFVKLAKEKGMFQGAFLKLLIEVYERISEQNKN